MQCEEGRNGHAQEWGRILSTMGAVAGISWGGSAGIIGVLALWITDG